MNQPARSGRRSLGIDLDGVLANQIDGVLPRIRELYGLALTYEDITDWQLPIGATDIAKEIVASQTERDYVLAMPAHAGAREMLEAVGETYRIVVLTARKGDALEWSAEWLNQHSLPFDDLVGSSEAKKSLHGVDALVDDYLGNIEEFLVNASGPAILVDQPWNRVGRDDLAQFVESRRLATVTSLSDVAGTLAELAPTHDEMRSRR